MKASAGISGLMAFFVLAAAPAQARDDLDKLPDIPDLPKATITACVLAGAISESEAVPGSNPVHARALISLEREKTKSPLGKALHEANGNFDILRCSFTGQSVGHFYDSGRNTVLLSFDDMDSSRIDNWTLKDLAGAFEEDIHAWQVQSREKLAKEISGSDAFGLMVLTKSMELEAKALTSVVLFERGGPGTDVRTAKSQLFRNGKPLELDVQVQTIVAKALENAPAVPSQDIAWMQNMFSRTFGLLFADDSFYSGRYARWAEQAALPDAPAFDLSKLGEFFPSVPGAQGHLAAFRLNDAVQEAGEANAEFIRKHRPGLLAR